MLLRNSSNSHVFISQMINNHAVWELIIQESGITKQTINPLTLFTL